MKSKFVTVEVQITLQDKLSRMIQRTIRRVGEVRIAAGGLTRYLSTAVVAPAKQLTQPASGAVANVKPTQSSRGSTFFERLSSFLAGCGVGFGTSIYFIYNELVDANEKLEKTLQNKK